MKKEAETQLSPEPVCAVWEWWGLGGGGEKNLYWLSVRHCVNTHLLNNLATAKSACD